MKKKKKPPRAGTERINFTKRTIEALLPQDQRRTFYDTQTRDLGLRVEPNNRKSFFWFRQVAGRPKFKALGVFPGTSIEAARGAASELSGQLDALKRTNFSALTPNPFAGTRGELTLETLLEDYIERRLKTKSKNPARAEENARRFFSYVKEWGGRKLSQVGKREVIDRHHAIGEKSGRITANRCTQLLRTLYFFAERNERFHGLNPAAKIEYFPEKSRERFLQPDELPRFFAAVKKEPSKDMRDFACLALWTSARRGDLLAARWEDISLEDHRWRIPNPKNRKAYDVALGPEAIAVLKGRRNGSPWVFPSYGESGHLINLNKRWKALLKRAKLSDLHLHDLRRTLPSIMAAESVSLQIIGKSLGHSSTAATQVYARLNLDPVREAVRAATAVVMAASKRRPKLLPQAIAGK